MDSLSELKRDISMGLQDELNKRLLPGESIIISIQGSFGEALIVTDRRAIVLREQASGLDLVSDVYAYPLDRVTGAAVVPSSAGGYIELKLTDPVADAETARVYYPLAEGARFVGAAEYLSKPAAAPKSPAAEPAKAVASEPGTCPKCGSKVADDAAFCAQCGEALQAICLTCGSPVPFGARYCCRCGRGFAEYKAECVKCGARVLRSMLYCPECGSIQRPVCMGCGTPLTPDWKYCAYCGRALDSDKLDACARASAVRRIKGMQEQEADRQPGSIPEAETGAAPPTDSAEAHNLRGKELFESEDFEGAIREFAVATAMEPNNSAYHCNLGMAYDEADRDAEALAEYQKALELDPNDLTALVSLGYMYSESDRFDQAQEVWGKVLQIAPDSAEAREVRDNLRHQGQL
jgi:tetratricopeptide (TPR) repeat protein